MGSVSPAQVSDGTTIDASDVNNPINTIANEFNGNIDNTNIKAAAAITGSKLADNSIDITTKASTWDGWVQVTDTWTYASATTVTVPSDATTKYSVGDKVKFTNGSTKYFYITAVASTVLTLNGGTDYTVANSAITGVYYSKAETPLSFPQWFAFSPTLTNVTEGNGTKTCRFSLNGKMLSVMGKFTLGSTSSISGQVSTTHPINIATTTLTSEVNFGVASFANTGVDIYAGTLYYGGASSFFFVKHYVSGSDIKTSSAGIITSTSPFTFGSTDSIVWQYSGIEIA